MTYAFRRDQYYRMPTHFGPSLGPRQGLDGLGYACIESLAETDFEATFMVSEEQLSKLLPPGFKLRGLPTITFAFGYITNIEWLAGRGYNTFGVKIPATYIGTNETVHGSLLLVLWENKADPIITGREELGFSKMYCELPEAQRIGSDGICRASWDGFEFASLKLSGLSAVNPDDVSSEPADSVASEGTLHYKYVPKTGCPGVADAAYATLTPAACPNSAVYFLTKAKTLNKKRY